MGSGPAGLSVARRLAGSALRVAVIEGGGREPEVRQQALYRGAVVGHPYLPLERTRFRLFGGTSNRWGGWCRALDDSDFEARPWVDAHGWPISGATLASFHDDAAALLRVGGPKSTRDALGPPLALGGEAFGSAVVRHCEQTNFAELERSSALDVLLHGSVVSLCRAAGSDRVERAIVRSLDGHTLTVRADRFVLATGGIENARLLLASDIGNEHDQVGRCFMEHLHVAAGHLLLERAGLDGGFHRPVRFADGTGARGLTVPTAAAQRAYELPNASIAVEPAAYFDGTPFLGWPPWLTVHPVRAQRWLARRDDPRAGLKLRSLSERAARAVKQQRTLRASRAALRRHGLAQSDLARIRSLYFRTEQPPRPSSRVTLDLGDRDALGVPRSRLAWQVDGADLDAVVAWRTHLDAAARAGGVGRVLPAPEGWQSRVIGGPHHMGTTRMSHSPRHGVVDTDCRVHTVPNLYVAGSSVFSTGGHANPTLTLVALALRLGDHLAATR